MVRYMFIRCVRSAFLWVHWGVSGIAELDVCEYHTVHYSIIYYDVCCIKHGSTAFCGYHGACLSWTSVSIIQNIRDDKIWISESSMRYIRDD